MCLNQDSSKAHLLQLADFVFQILKSIVFFIYLLNLFLMQRHKEPCGLSYKSTGILGCFAHSYIPINKIPGT